MIRTATFFASAALAFSPPAAAQPVTQSEAQMVLLAQSFDGSLTRSHSRSAGVAEARRGDARWMLVDYGEGTVVERGNGTIAGGLVVNRSAAELGLAYDPATDALTGDVFLAGIFNRTIRPLADRAPPNAAAWTLRFSPAEAGVAGASASAISVRFTRQDISAAGRSLTLVDYRIPGFSFTDAGGAGIAQWGRGGALIDAATGALLWSGSNHRAVAQQGEAARPYRATFSAVAADAGGKPLVDTAAIAELQPLLTALYGKEASAPLPFAPTTTAAAPRAPLHLAAVIDLVAIAAAQQGVDGHSAALAGFLLGLTGDNAAVAPSANSTGDSQ